jgi:deoxycytidylate deaminase
MVYNPPTENEGYNFNLTVHAEIRAISQVSPEKLKGATVYIAKIGKDGTNRFSRPCANCMNALTEAGVKHVVYTVG